VRTEKGVRDNFRPPFSAIFSVVELAGLQRPGNLVRTEDNCGRKCFGADELELACRRSLRKEAFSRTQQHRIDDQQDFIGKPMVEQR
jgi:hypothetical protein